MTPKFFSAPATALSTLCVPTAYYHVCVLQVAWTGIAATLLVGGRTVHAQFKLPVSVMDDSTCFVSAASPLTDKLRAASLIVWDEAKWRVRKWS